MTINHNLPLLKSLISQLYSFKCSIKFLEDINGTITLNGVKLTIELDSSDCEGLENFRCLKATWCLDTRHPYIKVGTYYFFIEEYFDKCSITFKDNKDNLHFNIHELLFN